MKKATLCLVFILISTIIYAQTAIGPTLNNPKGLLVIGDYIYFLDNNKLERINLINPSSTELVTSLNYSSYTLEPANDGFFVPNTGQNNIVKMIELSNNAYSQNSNYIDGTGGVIGLAFQDEMGDVYFTRAGTSNSTQLRKRLSSSNSSSIVANIPNSVLNVLDVATIGPEFYFSTTNGRIWKFNRNNPSSGFTLVLDLGAGAVISGIEVTQDYIYYANGNLVRVLRSNGGSSTNILTNANIVNVDIKDNEVYGITNNLPNDRIYKYVDPNLPSPCGTPLNITAQQSGANSVQISWDAVTNAISYDVAYVELGQPFANATVVNTTATSQNITGLSSSQYDIYVRTNCTSQTSNYSNPVRFRFPIRIYVDIDATGSNDGSSWTDAYTSLDSAIGNAGNNDEIWISEGIYVATAATTAFPINRTLAIYGGFNGTETQLSQRDFITHKTILSGDRNQNDDLSAFPFMANEPTRSDNSRTIININASDVVLDGISIQGGHNTATQFSAIIINYNNVSNFTLRNSEVAYNYATGVCSGIHIAPNTDSNISITNNKIQYNSSNTGTGIYIVTQANITTNITIANNLFNNNRIIASGNTFTGSAGWIRAFAPSSTINLDFINNTLVNHQNDTPSSPNTLNTIFGITQEDGTMNANVVNNIFWDNSISNSSIIPHAISSVLNGGNTYGNTTVSPKNIAQLKFTLFPNSPGSTANPLFTNSANNDFTLQANSPAINAGDNNSIPSSITTDLAGNTRIYNTTVDLGAYEYETSLNTNDFSGISKIHIFPNPASTTLNVISSDISIKSIEVFNMLGEKITTTESQKIDVKNLKKGVYLIKIKSDNNRFAIKKFIRR